MSEAIDEKDTGKRMIAFRDRTPARVFAGRVGVAYRTETHLRLRCDHAFARDAVQTEFDHVSDLGEKIVKQFGLFPVQTAAGSKSEFLKRPDLGRKLNETARLEIASRCNRGVDLQIAIGDGLSTTAVAVQVPGLLPLLVNGAAERGWSVGQPFAIRYCRVGVLNEIGELLDPTVVVLLIGERPGLATSESLSAYMAFRPRSGHTDAQRNLISNIHRRGIGQVEATGRILAMVGQMIASESSGVNIKECLTIPEIPR